MKRFTAFLSLCCLMLAMAIPALAAVTAGKPVYSNYSTTKSTVVYSSAYNVIGFKTKQLQVTGTTLTSNASSTTFKNMSGTVAVECSATSSGPWAACVNNNYAQTAVSVTTNSVMSWEDVSSYVRLKYTAGTGKIKAWLNWLDN